MERPKKKRKPAMHPDGPRTKRPKTGEASTSGIKHTKLTLKLGPRPATPEPFPCCLCVSMSREALLPLHEPPIGRKDIAVDLHPSSAQGWMAHEDCANVIPETWIDWVEYGDELHDGSRAKVKKVFGVDGIVKDRWNLVSCSALSLSMYSHVGERNVLRARRAATERTGHRYSAPKGSVLKLSM